MNKLIKLAVAAIMAAGCGIGATASTGDFNVFGFGERIEASSKSSIRTITIDGSYSTLKVTRGITVNFMGGSGKTTAKVSGPENLVELASVKVEKGVLTVTFTKEFNIKGNNIIVDITGALPSNYNGSAGAIINVNPDVNDIESLKVNGSAGAAVNFNGNVSAKVLDASVSAGASVNFNGETKVQSGNVRTSAGGDANIMNITAQDLKLSVSAGGEIKAAGSVKSVNARASAGGEVNIKKLKADYSDLKASAGGEIRK